MRYEDFRQTWLHSIQGAGFFALGYPEEHINPSTMSRSFALRFEPHGGQDAEPFYVTATIKWKWGALLSARTESTEEDMLVELLGRTPGDAVETKLPWVRIDTILYAMLPYGKPMPMPSAGAWQRWSREVNSRLERASPLLPEEVVRQDEDGDLEILGWKDEPRLLIDCRRDGALLLTGVQLSSWQAVTLPRQWEDPDREDDTPEEQIDQLCERVRRALHAWMESLDNLRTLTPQ